MKLRLFFEDFIEWEIRFQSTRQMISIGETPCGTRVCDTRLIAGVLLYHLLSIGLLQCLRMELMQLNVFCG